MGTVHKIEIGDITVSAKPVSVSQVRVNMILPQAFSEKYDPHERFSFASDMHLSRTYVNTKQTSQALSLLVDMAEIINDFGKRGYKVDSKFKTISIHHKDKGIVVESKMHLTPAGLDRSYGHYKFKDLKKAHKEFMHKAKSYSEENETEFQKQIRMAQEQRELWGSRQILQFLVAQSPNLTAEESLYILDQIEGTHFQTPEEKLQFAKRLCRQKLLS